MKIFRKKLCIWPNNANSLSFLNDCRSLLLKI